MPAGSFDVAPTDLDLPHQLVDACLRGQLALFGEVGVTQRGEDGLVPEDLLHFQQVNARFNQMGGIAVAQAVWGEFFLGRKFSSRGAMSFARRRDPGAWSRDAIS